MEENRLNLGEYEFAIDTAHFRYITQSISGPGWDFHFSGPCLNDDPEELIFSYGAQLYTEVAPFPMEKSADYTGVELDLPDPFDDDTGEPYFGLKVWEEHEVYDLKMRFLRREGHRYLIELIATVGETVLGTPQPLSLLAWAEERPDHAYPV